MKLSYITEEEKRSLLAKYYYKGMPPVTEDVLNAIKAGPVNPEDVLPFTNINDLLKPGYLKVENGYCILPDGVGFVAVLTKMPKVTGEMMDWWFWWIIR